MIFLSVFDPDNKVFGIKYPLFAILILISIPNIVFSNNNSKARASLINYFLIFSLLIPVYGLFTGIIAGSEISLSGWGRYFFAYLYLSLAICIINDIDYSSRVFFVALNCLSFLIIGIFTLERFINLQSIYDFGNTYGLYVFGKRTYGGASLNVVYYVTSPLLVMSAAYWAYTVARNMAPVNIVMLFVTSTALFLSGTRANIFMSIAIPFVSFIFYKRTLLNIVIAFVGGISAFFVNYIAIIGGMLSLSNYSNSIKLGYLTDYIRIANNVYNAIFGQGLGAYFFATPLNMYVNVTELTYLEIFRMYGLFVGALVIVMLIFPLNGLTSLSCSNKRYIYIGYAFYLLVSMINPYIFSSNGMLVLSVVLANYYSQTKARLDNSGLSKDTPEVAVSSHNQVEVSL